MILKDRIEKKDIVLVTECTGFPEGYGAASIMKKYAMGFTQIGYNTRIFLLRPSEQKGSARNVKTSGVYKNVSFCYLCGSVYTSSSFFWRCILYGIAYIQLFMKLFFNQKRINTVFFYSPEHYGTVKYLKMLCKICKIHLIGIKTESSYRNPNLCKQKKWLLKEKKMHSCFERMWTISEYIKEQLRNLPYQKEIRVAPILIDINMFEGLPHLKEKTIVFCGDLDRVEEVKNVRIVCDFLRDLNCGWKLEIAGGMAKSGYDQKAILDNEVVIYHGILTQEDVAKMLDRASICILPRAIAEYSNAGFPMKLGEYLLSGAATVVTDIGEISNDLINGQEVFISNGDDMSDYCSKVKKLIFDDELRVAMGEKGRKAAIRNFNMVDICKRMISE